MTNAHAPVPVICITFGHPSSMIEEALGPAIALSQSGVVTATILDDSSGSPPQVVGARTVTTPGNHGYAAAVNYAVTTLARESDRVLFVNPDAELSTDTMHRLLSSAFSETVIAPAIATGGQLENLRRTLKVSDVLTMLVAQRLTRQHLHPRASEDVVGRVGDGWVPAGTVLSFDADYLRKHPLNPAMFWVEMSAWARDHPDATFRILREGAIHAGGSTEGIASPAVTASRLAAQVEYVRQYGRPAERLLLPVCFILGRLLQLLSRRITLRGCINLIQLFRRKRTWQQVRVL